jgi:hypothetical protein
MVIVENFKLIYDAQALGLPLKDDEAIIEEDFPDLKVYN